MYCRCNSCDITYIIISFYIIIIGRYVILAVDHDKCEFCYRSAMWRKKIIEKKSSGSPMSSTRNRNNENVFFMTYKSAYSFWLSCRIVFVGVLLYRLRRRGVNALHSSSGPMRDVVFSYSDINSRTRCWGLYIKRIRRNVSWILFYFIQFMYIIMLMDALSVYGVYTSWIVKRTLLLVLISWIVWILNF